jgi:hypothetical protein
MGDVFEVAAFWHVEAKVWVAGGVYSSSPITRSVLLTVNAASEGQSTSFSVLH